MAGASSGWMKMPAGSVKARAFVSAAGVRDLYGDPTMSARDVAIRKRELSVDPSNAEVAAALSLQPQGQAKTRVPIQRRVGGVPVRSQAELDGLGGKLIGMLRDWVQFYGGNDVIKKIAKKTDSDLATMITDTMKRVIADADVSMRVSSAILGRILQDGFKNQHATNTTKGDLDPAGRMRAEHNMHGVPLDAPPEAYPVYGYLAAKGAPLSEESGTSSYGDARITFKDSVRERTSFTIGDSLYPAINNQVLAAPIDQPHVASGSGAGSLLSIVKGAIKNAPAPEMLKIGGYWETQIHGPTTAADIARVSFSTYTPDPHITAQLDALGIPWGIG